MTPTTATAAPISTKSRTPPGAFIRLTVKSLVDSRLSCPAPRAKAARVKASPAYTTACAPACIFLPALCLVGKRSKSKMSSPACHRASAIHPAKLTHRSAGPAGWLASSATAPLTSARPPRPRASPKAMKPIRMWSTPLAANPPRASISRGLEFVTSSALPAALLSSRLMIAPLRRQLLWHNATRLWCHGGAPGNRVPGWGWPRGPARLNPPVAEVENHPACLVRLVLEAGADAALEAGGPAAPFVDALVGSCVFRAHGSPSLLDRSAAHQRFDAGLPHVGERTLRAAALAVVKVFERLGSGEDVADMHGVVGPVRGDAPKAARLQRLGGELGEFGLDEAALVVPGLVPRVREEDPQFADRARRQHGGQDFGGVRLDDTHVGEAAAVDLDHGVGQPGSVDLHSEEVLVRVFLCGVADGVAQA